MKSGSGLTHGLWAKLTHLLTHPLKGTQRCMIEPQENMFII